MTSTLKSNTRSRVARHFSTLVALIAISLVGGAANAQNIRTTVNGDLVSFPDVQPIMINSRVMVPVRGVFEHINANVDWDPNTQMVTAQRGTDTIKLEVNSTMAWVNDVQISLDSPAVIRDGRTMVPLRFISESLGATVEWLEATRTVQIVTTEVADVGEIYVIQSNTVVPFTLVTPLNSSKAEIGDKFVATINAGPTAEYEGLPKGTKLEGKVDAVRAKTGDDPGVLGLEFDRVILPNGQTYMVNGSLSALDEKSVTNENGRLVSKPGADDNLKWVGYGAGAGVLVAILTDGNIFTSTLIGAALGLLIGEIQPDGVRDVNLEAGTEFGVRLEQDLLVRK